MPPKKSAAPALGKLKPDPVVGDTRTDGYVVDNLLQVVLVEAHRLGRELDDACDEELLFLLRERRPRTDRSRLGRAPSTQPPDSILDCALVHVERHSSFAIRHTIGWPAGGAGGNSEGNPVAVIGPGVVMITSMPAALASGEDECSRLATR